MFILSTPQIKIKYSKIVNIFYLCFMIKYCHIILFLGDRNVNLLTPK